MILSNERGTFTFLFLPGEKIRNKARWLTFYQQVCQFHGAILNDRPLSGGSKSHRYRDHKGWHEYCFVLFRSLLFFPPSPPTQPHPDTERDLYCIFPSRFSDRRYTVSALHRCNRQRQSERGGEREKTLCFQLNFSNEIPRGRLCSPGSHCL